MSRRPYMEMQRTPRAGRERERRTGELLETAARHLVRAAELVGSEPRDYRQILDESVSAIRGGYEALLEWHGVALPPDLPLVELSTPAENLVSMLRTSRDRTFHLESLQETLSRNGDLPLAACEQAGMSFYTARNTLWIIAAALPARLTREASSLIERAGQAR